MDHAAVQAGCLLTGGFVLLDACYGEPLLRQLPDNRAADNAAGSYEADVEHRSGKSEKRSEEHTSELQSRLHLVCRLLLEKKYYRTCLPACLTASVPSPRHSCFRS